MSDPAIIVVNTAPASNIVVDTTNVVAEIVAGGSIGPQGPAGAQGIQGEQGIQGIQGETGPQGPAGSNGSNGINGTNGTNGTNGIDGTDGADGVGVPAGGTAGQVLSKIDSTNYNTQWVDQSSGGSDIQTYIQTTQPSVTVGTKYVWWDISGGNLTLWIEDGL